MEDSNLCSVSREGKTYAEIQPFLNITDSVVETRKTGPGRDLPHIRSWTQSQSAGKHKSGESKSFLLSGSCRIVCLFLIFGKLVFIFSYCSAGMLSLYYNFFPMQSHLAC